MVAVERGIPRRVLREIFSVSLSTLKRWLKIGRDREGGQGPLARALHGKEQAHPPHPRGEERLLWEQLEANDDATLERHCELWEQETGVGGSVSAMSRAIRAKLGWSYEKRGWVPPSETKKVGAPSASV